MRPQLLCDLQAPPIFPAWRATSDRTLCDRPLYLAGTSRDGPIQSSCIFVAGGGENFISREKIKSTAATILWLKNGISRSVSVTCRDMQGRAKTHPRPSWLVSRLSWLVPSSWALATSRSCDRGVTDWSARRIELDSAVNQPYWLDSVAQYTLPIISDIGTGRAEGVEGEGWRCFPRCQGQSLW